MNLKSRLQHPPKPNFKLQKFSTDGRIKDQLNLLVSGVTFISARIAHLCFGDVNCAYNTPDAAPDPD